MSTDVESGGPARLREMGRVHEMLATEFAGRLDERTVRSEVTSAERELSGQVPPGSVAEMAHRLAAHRLGQRCPG